MLREANFAANDAARLDATAFSLATGIKVPGPGELQAAWETLPAETRDRIGMHALAFAFYDWLSTDEQAVPPDRRLLSDEVADHCGELASEAANALFALAVEASPILYGDKGAGPAWAKQVAR